MHGLSPVVHNIMQGLVDFLDRSRSATSRSNSTSTAPAPSLSPATVGFATISSKIIDIVYSDAVAPESLRQFNSRDLQSLQSLAVALIPILNTRKHALVTYLADCERGVIQMSDKTKAFWNEKKSVIEIQLQQLAAGSGEHTEGYFAVARQTWERAIPDALTKVSEEIVGPYVLGGISVTPGIMSCNSPHRGSAFDRGHPSLCLAGTCCQPFRWQLHRHGGCRIDESRAARRDYSAKRLSFFQQAGGVLGCDEEAAELEQRFCVEAKLRCTHVHVDCYAETLRTRLVVILFTSLVSICFGLQPAEIQSAWNFLPTVRRLGDANVVMRFPSLFGSSRPWQSGEHYEFLSGPDPQEVYWDTSNFPIPVGEHTDSSYPDTTHGDRSSSDSATSYTTPAHSRAPTPSPPFPAHRFTTSASDGDGEPASPLLEEAGAYPSIRDGNRRWWNYSRRRRKRDGKIWRTFKKGVRRVVRHPWFPQQPITIVRSFHTHCTLTLRSL